MNLWLAAGAIREPARSCNAAKIKDEWRTPQLPSEFIRTKVGTLGFDGKRNRRYGKKAFTPRTGKAGQCGHTWRQAIT